MPNYTGQSYTDLKNLLAKHETCDVDDVEAETYLFRLRNDRIEYKRKGSSRSAWSRVSPDVLKFQFLIGNNAPLFARVG